MTFIPIYMKGHYAYFIFTMPSVCLHSSDVCVITQPCLSHSKYTVTNYKKYKMLVIKNML